MNHMKPMKLLSLLLLFAFHTDSFCQSSYDSTFIQKIINLELKERDKKLKKAFPIAAVSYSDAIDAKIDTVYTNFGLGKDIQWESFNIKSRHAYFTNDSKIDSCLYIYAPLFTANCDQFVIRYEIRYQNETSYFIADFYRKKRGKWNYVRTSKGFSF